MPWKECRNILRRHMQSRLESFSFYSDPFLLMGLNRIIAAMNEQLDCESVGAGTPLTNESQFEPVIISFYPWKAGKSVRPLFLSPEPQEDIAMAQNARYSIGDLVHHKLFDYRGVIVDVDPRLMLSNEWYEAVARSRPPKNQPWYRVLVHDSIHETYVAERNLEPDTSNTRVRHPLVDTFFGNFSDGHYSAAGRMN